ncbi:uncharacterized protein LOC124273656 [Haliotis rubra]|uniref:uncharacterized protein LOC124273656 n=1 Tax=Haliotis rubra TaxID=36100 RepID=UPI001EE50E14|nr:uncharacterized protein LOC124273656 [Haliotis rubra]
MDYQEVQKYWEIREDEAELGDGIRNQNNESTSDVSDDALPALADYFPGAVNVVAEDDDVVAGHDGIQGGVGDVEAEGGDIEADDDVPDGTTGSSVSDDHSYTHLTMDVPVAGPRTVALYISPLED